MNKKKIKKWAVAALIRAAKTMAQTAAATLSVAVVMSDVNWVMVASSTLLAGILSMLTSVGRKLKKARNNYDKCKFY